MIVVILQLLFDDRAVAFNIVWLVLTASYLYNIKQASNTYVMYESIWLMGWVCIVFWHLRSNLLQYRTVTWNKFKVFDIEIVHTLSCVGQVSHLGSCPQAFGVHSVRSLASCLHHWSDLHTEDSLPHLWHPCWRRTRHVSPAPKPKSAPAKSRVISCSTHCSLCSHREPWNSGPLVKVEVLAHLGCGHGAHLCLCWSGHREHSAYS